MDGDPYLVLGPVHIVRIGSKNFRRIYRLVVLIGHNTEALNMR